MQTLLSFSLFLLQVSMGGLGLWIKGRFSSNGRPVTPLSAVHPCLCREPIHSVMLCCWPDACGLNPAARLYFSAKRTWERSVTQDDSMVKGRLVRPAEAEPCVTGNGTCGQLLHACRALNGSGEKENQDSNGSIFLECNNDLTLKRNCNDWKLH